MGESPRAVVGILLLLAAVVAVSSALPLSGSEGALAGGGADPGLDPAFGGGNGTIRTDFPGSPDDLSLALALQPDGKIIAAGGTGPIFGPRDFALARYNPDGSLDTSFGGGDGLVTTDFGADRNDSAFALAIQADGTIIVSGSTASGDDSDFAVARYLPDGSLDATFGGGDGLATIEFSPGDNSAAFDIAFRPGAGYVVAGRTRTGSANAPIDLALAGLEPDGDLDPAFGAGGRRTTDLGGFEVAAAVAIQADGRILAAGGELGADGNFFVVRYEPNAELDTSFGGGDGAAEVDFGGDEGERAGEILVEPDGRIVLAGATFAPSDFAVARLLPSGELDATFGGDGKVTTDLATRKSTVSSDGGFGAALQTDGRIVVVGDSRLLPGNTDVAAARYLPDGSLDPTFGGGDGRITTDVGGADDFGRAVAVQSDGKIIAGGWTESAGSGLDIALVRYLSSLPPRCSGREADVVGTARGEKLKGTRKGDVIAALGGADRVVGRAGKDRICGGGGQDRLRGGRGRDRLLGGPGRDDLAGARGRDVLRGGPGRDREQE